MLHRLQLFALQGESRDQKDGDEMVHHKLPAYVQNMDRLEDTELWDTNSTALTHNCNGQIADLLQLRWLP